MLTLKKYLALSALTLTMVGQMNAGISQLLGKIGWGASLVTTVYYAKQQETGSKAYKHFFARPSYCHMMDYVAEQEFGKKYPELVTQLPTIEVKKDNDSQKTAFIINKISNCVERKPEYTSSQTRIFDCTTDVPANIYPGISVGNTTIKWIHDSRVESMTKIYDNSKHVFNYELFKWIETSNPITVEFKPAQLEQSVPGEIPVR